MYPELAAESSGRSVAKLFDFYFNFLVFSFLGFWQENMKNALVEFRPDLICLNTHRETERAFKGTTVSLDIVMVFILFLGLFFLLFLLWSEDPPTD